LERVLAHVQITDSRFDQKKQEVLLEKIVDRIYQKPIKYLTHPTKSTQNALPFFDIKF